MKNALLLSFLTILLTTVLTCSFNKADNVDTNTAANINSSANATPNSTPASAGAQSQMATAEALVADLYKQHDAKKSPFFQTKNRGLVDKYFTKSTADLIWKDATSSQGEVGALAGDPLYDAQDTDTKNFAISQADVKGDNATVAVNFTNFGEKKTITFLLKIVKDSWKIDDIKWSQGDSMIKVIKEAYSVKTEAGTTGEFEGKFQVGETTCTVKPVKMAFEIRWKKGSGVEMFFADGENAFASSPDSSGSNRFVFDDENYNSGTFYRADGKTFPVKRAR